MTWLSLLDNLLYVGAMAAAALVARWIMGLSSPRQDWQCVRFFLLDHVLTRWEAGSWERVQTDRRARRLLDW